MSTITFPCHLCYKTTPCDCIKTNLQPYWHRPIYQKPELDQLSNDDLIKLSSTIDEILRRRALGIQITPGMPTTGYEHIFANKLGKDDVS